MTNQTNNFILLLLSLSAITSCNNNRSLSDEGLNSVAIKDSVQVSPDIDSETMDIVYAYGEFWVGIDNSAKIINYSSKLPPKEYVVSNIIYFDNSYMIQGEITSGFMVTENFIYCFQNSPTQIRKVNLQEETLDVESPIELKGKKKLKFIAKKDSQSAWVAVSDETAPYDIELSSINVVSNKLINYFSISLENSAETTEDILIRLFNDTFYVLPQYSNTIYRYTIDGKPMESLMIPEFESREYIKRPEFQGGPNKFISLDKESRSKYFSDTYVDFHFSKDTFHIIHKVFERNDFTKKSYKFLLTSSQNKKLLFEKFFDDNIIRFNENSFFNYVWEDDSTAWIYKKPLTELIPFISSAQ